MNSARRISPGWIAGRRCWDLAIASSCSVRLPPDRNVETLFHFCQHLVVVHYLDVVGIPFTPHKTKTPLVVDPDTVLPLTLAAQGFQTVPRWRCQIAQLRSAVQLAKLSAGDPFHGSKASTRLPAVKSTLSSRGTGRPQKASPVGQRYGVARSGSATGEPSGSLARRA